MPICERKWEKSELLVHTRDSTSISFLPFPFGLPHAHKGTSVGLPQAPGLTHGLPSEILHGHYNCKESHIQILSTYAWTAFLLPYNPFLPQLPAHSTPYALPAPTRCD